MKLLDKMLQWGRKPANWKPEQVEYIGGRDITSAIFRSGKFDVAVYDEDGRQLHTFQECTRINSDYFTLTFHDGQGLKVHFSGFKFSYQERP